MTFFLQKTSRKSCVEKYKETNSYIKAAWCEYLAKSCPGSRSWGRDWAPPLRAVAADAGAAVAVAAVVDAAPPAVDQQQEGGCGARWRTGEPCPTVPRQSSPLLCTQAKAQSMPAQI
jgi:hypothetical protein